MIRSVRVINTDDGLGSWRTVQSAIYIVGDGPLEHGSRLDFNPHLRKILHQVHTPIGGPINVWYYRFLVRALLYKNGSPLCYVMFNVYALQTYVKNQDFVQELANRDINTYLHGSIEKKWIQDVISKETSGRSI